LRLTLIAVGRVAEPFIREACDHYSERIRRYARFSLTVVPEERVSSAGHKSYILRREGEKIRTRLPGDAVVVALDERGQALTSEAFARILEKWSQWGSKEVAFILGGPYGLEGTLRNEADHCLSLSSMTLTHGIARMFLLEQIYRACTLLRGEPYHK
jgi:23S rRNA (pseudouridine1915-N3)-methyltransferase